MPSIVKLCAGDKTLLPNTMGTVMATQLQALGTIGGVPIIMGNGEGGGGDGVGGDGGGGDGPGGRGGGIGEGGGGGLGGGDGGEIATGLYCSIWPVGHVGGAQTPVHVSAV